jgi:hypothetical protein
VFVTHFVVLLPGPLWTDIILLYILPIVVYFLIIAISPYSTLFYIKFHKLFYLFRKKPKYGIYSHLGDISAGKILLRSLKVSFFSFTIGVYLIQAGLGSFFRFNFSETALFRSEAIFLSTYFLVPFVMIIFFTLWILEDSGVVAYRKFKNKRKNPDIEGVNRIFRDFLEYFIGFSTILAYLNIIGATIVDVLGDSGWDPAMLIPIILIFLPFLIPGLFAVPMIFYEYNYERNLENVRKYLLNKDYPNIVIPDFDDLYEKKKKK